VPSILFGIDKQPWFETVFINHFKAQSEGKLAINEHIGAGAEMPFDALLGDDQGNGAGKGLRLHEVEFKSYCV
jgi:hypothetical protein